MEIGPLPIVGSRLFAIQMLSSARVENADPLIKVKTIQGGHSQKCENTHKVLL